MSYSILITGDLVINKIYDESNIEKEVIGMFDQADLRIVNLEAPVTESTSRITKTGPHLKAHKESTFKVLKALNIDVVTLANNHILDYDEQGVEDTLTFCKESKIKTVGAGMSLEEASKTLFIETDEGNIAVVNFAENEWTSATNSTAGSNPLCLEDNYKQIIEAKKNADFVITIVHGGHEHFHYPSPDIQKRYRFLADIGSDAVVAHHTHCVGAMEMYHNVPICYSLGNFLFPMKKEMRMSWYTGLIASLDIKKGQPIQVQLLSIRLDKDSNELRLLNGIEKERIEEQLSLLNAVILKPDELEKKFIDFVKKVHPSIIKQLTPIGAFTNRYIRGALYKTGIYKVSLNELYIKESLNRIRCESHHEVVMSVYSEMLKKYKK